MTAKKPTAREFAAIVYALAVARGVLYSVQIEDTNGRDLMDEIKRILNGTSAANIAKALGLEEKDIALDWNEYLTELQKQIILGEGDV
jgi:hypothetical protein